MSRRQRGYGPYRDLGSLANGLVALFVVGAVLEASGAISQLGGLELFDRMGGAGPWTQAEAEAYDARQGLIGLAQLGIALVTSVVFLIWTHAVCKNAWSFQPLKVTPGWAVGWFFVPIVNLWRPFQNMTEIWHASDPDAVAAARGSRGGSTAILGLWWTGWIASGVLGQFAGGMLMGARTVDSLRTATQVSLVEHAIAIGLAVVVVMMVQQMTKRQREAKARGLDASVFD